MRTAHEKIGCLAHDLKTRCIRVFGLGTKSGLTVLEVLVSLAVLGVVGGAFVRSVIVARQLTYASSQRVSAFGLCQARIEEVRGFDYVSIAATNFPAETGIRLSHMGGHNQEPVTCDRTVGIQSLTGPDRKEVIVTVSWNYRGRNLQEDITGILYQR